MSITGELYPTPGAAPGAGTGAGVVQANGVPDAVITSAAGPVSSGGGGTATSKLLEFEGLLKKAGHIAGVVLTDIVKYVIPVASVVSIADPEIAPAMEAFVASVKLVETAVISVQQRWSAEGSAANGQKLADVLAIAEQPVMLLFAQAGVKVDLAYVTNLVNGVVAILNAQPGVVLPIGG